MVQSEEHFGIMSSNPVGCRDYKQVLKQIPFPRHILGYITTDSVSTPPTIPVVVPFLLADLQHLFSQICDSLLGCSELSDNYVVVFEGGTVVVFEVET